MICAHYVRSPLIRVELSPETEAKLVTEEPKPDKQPKPKATKTGPQAQSIPEVVSKRMISRIALFCGVPTILGISTFFVSYLIVELLINTYDQLQTVPSLLTLA